MPQPRAPRRAAARPGTRPDRVPANTPAPTASAAIMYAIGAMGPAGMMAGAAELDQAVARLPAATIRALLSTISIRYRRVSRQRHQILPGHVERVMVATRPAATAAEIRRAVAHERSRETEFRRRQQVRLRRDLGHALREPDPKRRLAKLDGIQRREAHYDRLRAAAVAQRVAGAADARTVLAASPEGAIWQLGPRDNHCPGCAFLAGYALPWHVLHSELMIPPLGPGCGCRLQGVRQAWLMGDTARLAPVLDTVGAMQVLERARELGHSHRHDGGVSLA